MWPSIQSNLVKVTHTAGQTCRLFLQGKNHERTFTYPKCSVRAMYPKFDKLLKLQEQHDPAGMFEPRLFRRVARNESFTLTPRCS
jgi:hypothetical protein